MADIWDRAYQRHIARCVYCGRDLLVDFDTYMSAELDHLIPTKSGGDDTDTNKVLACNVCNRLKGDYDPRSASPTPSDRDQLIHAARVHIAHRRAQQMEGFHGYLERYHAT